MLVDILIVLALTLINGFLSLCEMALVSARKGRLKMLADGTGPLAGGARIALKLKERPGRFLSTIQIGITLIGIGAGAFGGTQFSAPLASLLEPIPIIGPYAPSLAVILVVLTITFISLLIGELVPKNLALAAPERVAASVAGSIDLLSHVLAPGVWILDRVSAGLLAILGHSGSGTAKVTEEEIRYFVAEGAVAGAIESAERDMIYRVMRLGDKQAGDLMTPRMRFVALDRKAPLEDNLAKMRAHPASRFPVYDGDPAEIVGIVRVKDWVHARPGDEGDLFRILHEPIYVPESTHAVRLLEILQTVDLHMAIVVDEYGTVRGLVTLTDMMRAVVGEVDAERAIGGAALVQRHDGSYLVDGLRAADDLKDVLGLQALPLEADESYHTVAGLVIANLQAMPSEGDSFEYRGWRFEVIDLDGQRVDKVLISRVDDAKTQAEPAV